MNDRHEPIRITRRELLKCVLTLPLSVACFGLKLPHAHAQQDGFASPEWEWLLLWEGRALIGQRASEWRDIKGNNANAFATLQRALHYSQLVWMGYTIQGVSLDYRVLARSVGFEGAPLGVGWFQIAQGAFTAPAQRWFRLALDAAHWDEYRIEMRSRSPQVVYSRLLGRRDYMPLETVSRERTLVTAHPLLITTTNCDTTAKDLLGSTATETATIGSAGQYHTLVWTGFKRSTADTSYTVRARTTDLDGNPLGGGWLQIAKGTITGAADSWFRVVMTSSEGLYYDQYRFTISQASGSQEVVSKIVGVRR